MTTPGRDGLPTQVRMRIERLEREVSKLATALGALVAGLHRHGLDFTSDETVRTQADAVLGDSGSIKTARKSTSTRSITARGLETAVARGEAARVKWVQSGELVPAKVLAAKWGLTPQALGPAAKRREVFAIVVKRQRYFPREFLELDRDTVGAVTEALGDLPPSEKLVFWKRTHGALSGCTLLQTLSVSGDPRRLARVVQLARAWVDERRAGRDSAEAA